ncbi:hypothetical protein FOL47_000542 [Perkinsus chesapeaki]|uniref:Cyclic nucleotide-binding domain-containing protein n=1 Tax=Perkinsus chesapeaki TaxID=330153 RepID=A0A7J6N1V8_PERCH|nr:hypothetical protein FOL47_000542 [Perkinsus chesapeaki]
MNRLMKSATFDDDLHRTARPMSADQPRDRSRGLSVERRNRLSVRGISQLLAAMNPEEHALKERDKNIMKAEGIQDPEPTAQLVRLEAWEDPLLQRDKCKKIIGNLNDRGTRPKKPYMNELASTLHELLKMILAYRFKIFRDIPESQLKTMLKGLRLLKLFPGDHVWQEGQEANHAFLVLACGGDARIRVLTKHRTVLIAVLDIREHLEPNRKLDIPIQWQAIVASVRNSPPFRELSLARKEVEMFVSCCRRLASMKGCLLDLLPDSFFIVIAGSVRGIILIDGREVPVWEMRRGVLWVDQLAVSKDAKAHISHFVAYAEGETQVLWMPREWFLAILGRLKHLRQWFIAHDKLLLDKPDFNRKSVAYMGWISDKVSKAADTPLDVYKELWRSPGFDAIRCRMDRRRGRQPTIRPATSAALSLQGSSGKTRQSLAMLGSVLSTGTLPKRPVRPKTAL